MVRRSRMWGDLHVGPPRLRAHGGGVPAVGRSMSGWRGWTSARPGGARRTRISSAACTLTSMSGMTTSSSPIPRLGRHGTGWRTRIPLRPRIQHPAYLADCRTWHTRTAYTSLTAYSSSTLTAYSSLTSTITSSPIILRGWCDVLACWMVYVLDPHIQSVP